MLASMVRRNPPRHSPSSCGYWEEVMTKRWTPWAQLAYPLNAKDKANMIGACDAEFALVNPDRKRVKSPAQQFDESHAKWL
jgi:hypothetical protein